MRAARTRGQAELARGSVPTSNENRVAQRGSLKIGRIARGQPITGKEAAAIEIAAPPTAVSREQVLLLGAVALKAARQDEFHYGPRPHTRICQAAVFEVRF
jgi:hypothetical protein